MNEPDLAPLDPDVRELLDLERTPDPPSPGAKGRVWERVQESLLPGPPPGPAIPAAEVATASSGAALTVGALIVGAAVLVGVLGLPGPEEEAEPSAPNVHVRSLLPATVPAVLPDPPHVATPGVDDPTPEPEAGPAAVEPLSEPVAEPNVTRTATVQRPKRDAPDRLEEERRLLDGGRRALRDGRASDALDAVAAHKARYPRGKLVEEREALRIRAFDRMGKATLAREVALRFLARYPSSIHRDIVERIVGSKEP
jgi:hypothetical protein